MTRPRFNGKDSPFGAWLRSRSDLDSIRENIVASDIDWCIRKYQKVVDSIGNREVNLQLNFELKICGDRLTPAQQETLFCTHVCCKDKRKIVPSSFYSGKKIAIWHLGFYVLILEEDKPGGDYDTVTWCNFLDSGRLKETRIPVITLVGILGFNLRPDKPSEKLSVRRHHKTRILEESQRTELGFNTWARVIKRS